MSEDTLVPMPDYPNDLNAMHEAWLTLDEQEQWEFCGHLADVMREACPEADPTRIDALSINAPAGKRAEAFLRVIEGRGPR